MTDKDKFDPTDPKWGGTMRDVRDSIARGEGLNSDPYPYNNKEETEFWKNQKKKRGGCLSGIISVFLGKKK